MPGAIHVARIGAGLPTAGRRHRRCVRRYDLAAAACVESFLGVSQRRASRPGENPHPVKLVRPSAGRCRRWRNWAGRFSSIRACHRQAGCPAPSCHSPQHAYGPPGDLPVMRGGPRSVAPRRRAPCHRSTIWNASRAFAIGPDNEENENVTVAQLVALGETRRGRRKIAAPTDQAAANLVPQGGLFWDGRADTLQDQALLPLLDPREMDGGSRSNVVAGQIAAARLMRRVSSNCSAARYGSDTRLAVERGAVRGRALSDRGPELSPLYEQVRLLARRQGAAYRERTARLCAVQRSGQGQLRRLPSSTSRPATACRRCSPTTNSRLWARRAMPRSPSTGSRLFRSRYLRTLPHRHGRATRNIAGCS